MGDIVSWNFPNSLRQVELLVSDSKLEARLLLLDDFYFTKSWLNVSFCVAVTPYVLNITKLNHILKEISFSLVL